MRGVDGVGRYVAAVVVVVTLACGACAGGGDGDGADGAGASDRTPEVTGPRAPDAVGPGCGAQAVTDPGDLDAERVVARCGPGSPEPDPLPRPVTLRVATPLAAGLELAPLLVAEARGEFAAEGLTVRRYPMGAREAMDALERGDVDVVAGTIDAPYFDALRAGSGARLVLGGALTAHPNDQFVGQPGLWVADDEVPSGRLVDLWQEEVAIPGASRSGAAYPIGLALGQTEVSLNDLAVTDLGGSDAAQALLDGEVAAAWLDGGSWFAVAADEGYQQVVTLPASESIDGTIVSERLLGRDRPVGLAYVRAVVRTINTHLAGDYRGDEAVVAALAEATSLEPEIVRDLPVLVYDWEVRDGTAGRIEDALIAVGGVTYDVPLDPALLEDRSLAGDVVAAATPSA